MKILTLGKLSRNKEEVKAMIEKLGGKLTGTANKASLCISTKSELNLLCKAGPHRASWDGSEVGRGRGCAECGVTLAGHSQMGVFGHSILWSFMGESQHLYLQSCHVLCVCLVSPVEGC